MAAGVQHVIFSSLENVRAITGGKKWAPHFTDKAVIEDYIRGLPLTSSFVQLALFYSNLLEYYPPRQENGKLTFSLYLPADVPFPFVDALAAAGPAVREMFDRPDAYSGRTLPVIGEMLTPNAMVATFKRVTGIDATYQPCYTRATLLKQFPAFAANEPFVRELLGMAEYIIEYGYYRPDRDLLWSRQIDPQTLTWEGFLRQSAWRGEHQTFGVG